MSYDRRRPSVNLDEALKESDRFWTGRNIVMLCIVVLLALVLGVLLLLGHMKGEGRDLSEGWNEHAVIGIVQASPTPAITTQESTVSVRETAQSVQNAANPAPEETLPIIITNTPTPTPTARPTATPEPTPTPTPTPKPILGTGKTLKEGNLRETPSAKGKVRKQLKKNVGVTIHEVSLDNDGKAWYFLTVDDTGTEGWMRDYLIQTAGELRTDAAPVITALPDAGADIGKIGDGFIGRAVTNREANVRREPLQRAGVVRKLSEGVEVNLLRRVASDDAQWYEVETPSGKTHGYLRVYTLRILEEQADIETETYVP